MPEQLKFSRNRVGEIDADILERTANWAKERHGLETIIGPRLRAHLNKVMSREVRLLRFQTGRSVEECYEFLFKREPALGYLQACGMHADTKTFDIELNDEIVE